MISRKYKALPWLSLFQSEIIIICLLQYALDLTDVFINLQDFIFSRLCTKSGSLFEFFFLSSLGWKFDGVRLFSVLRILIWIYSWFVEYRGDDFFSVEYRCRQIFMDEEETLTFCLKMMVNLFFFFLKKKI